MRLNGPCSLCTWSDVFPLLCCFQFWTNLFPTKMQEKHAGEIRRFKWAIRFMRWTEVFWALIPIKIALKMLFFPDEYVAAVS